MSYSNARSISEAVLFNMSEQQMADWRRQEGGHVICRRGRYWEETHPGFYQAIHWMARLKQHEATRPALLTWGFRATLLDENANNINGFMPVHLLSDLQNFNEGILSQNRRYALRKCRRKVQIIQATGSEMIRERAYEVFVSSRQRLEVSYDRNKEKFLADIDRTSRDQRNIYLVGLIGGRLGGYLMGFAVEGTAYIHLVCIETEALKTQISLGLHYEFIDLCRRTPGIREVVHGQHFREKSSLEVFKESIGFKIVRVPSHVMFVPPMGMILRWRQPDKYYRLTGQE